MLEFKPYFTGIDDAVLKYRAQRVWAERGLIHIEDGRNSSYSCISVREWLGRLRALQEMVMESRKDPENHAYEAAIQLETLQQAIERGDRIARQAKEQGMPTDPSACRDLARRGRVLGVVPGRANLKTTF